MTPDDNTLLLLHAYTDGELSPGETLAMEGRLASDPELRRQADQLSALSGALRETLTSVPGSATLRGRVVEAVGFNDEVPRRRWVARWQPLAATLLVGFVAGSLIGSGAVYLGMAPGAPDPSAAVLAAHLRSLAAPQPFDIASSNKHVVKPWFNGRTTIAPGAPDLSDKGFPLAGGRIDIVGGEAVPTLVYRRDSHVISVTIVPGAAGAATGEERRGGSTIDQWRSGDLNYWAVSDLNAKDLRSFVDLFRTRLAQEG